MSAFTTTVEACYARWDFITILNPSLGDSRFCWRIRLLWLGPTDASFSACRNPTQTLVSPKLDRPVPPVHPLGFVVGLKLTAS